MIDNGICLTQLICLKCILISLEGENEYICIQTVDNCKHALNIVMFKWKLHDRYNMLLQPTLIGRIMPTPNRILK